MNIKDKNGSINFEKAKRILNKDGESYTDEQIKMILPLIDMWAKINARTIINKMHELKEQNSARS